MSLEWGADGLLITGGADHLVTAWRQRERVWTAGIPYASIPTEQRLPQSHHNRLPSVGVPQDEMHYQEYNGQTFRTERRGWHRQTWETSTPVVQGSMVYSPPDPYPWWGFGKDGSQKLTVERRELLAGGQSVARYQQYSAVDGRHEFAFPAAGKGRVLEMSYDRRYAVVVADDDGSRGSLEVWSAENQRPLGALGRYTLPSERKGGFVANPLSIVFALSHTRDWLLVCRPRSANAEVQMEVWRLPEVVKVGEIPLPTFANRALPLEGGHRFLVGGGSRFFPPQFSAVIDAEKAAKVCDLQMYEETGIQSSGVLARSHIIAMWHGPLDIDPVHISAWSLDTGDRKDMGETPWINSELPSIGVSADGERLLICGNSHETSMAHVELWDTVQIRLLQEASYPTEAKPRISGLDDARFSFALDDFPQKGKSTEKHWRLSNGAELPARPPSGPVMVTGSQVFLRNWDWILWRDQSGLLLQLGTSKQRTLLANTRSARFSGVSGPLGDGAPLVIWGENGGGIWDARTGAQIARISGSREFLGLDPTNRWVLIVDRTDGAIEAWDTATGRAVYRCVPARSPNQGFDPTRARMKLSPEGNRVAVLSQGLLRLWDLETNRAILTIDKPGHFGPVRCVAHDAGARVIASAGAEGVIHLWDSNSGKSVRTLLDDPRGVVALTFSPDGKWLASAASAGQVAVRDLEGRVNWSKQVGQSDTQIIGIAFEPGGSLILVVTQDGRVVLLDTNNGSNIAEYEIDATGIQSFACSPDRNVLALGGRGGLVHLWDIPRRQRLRQWETYSRVDAVAFAGGTSLLVTGGQSIGLWETVSGRNIVELAPPRGPVRALRVNEVSGELAVADAGEQVLVLSLPALFQQFEGVKLSCPDLSLAHWPRPSAQLLPVIASRPGAQEWQARAKEFLDTSIWGGLIFVCSEALESNPDEWRFWYWRGLGYFNVANESKQLREAAMADFSKALALEAGNPEIWYTRGLVLAQMRRWREAIADYSRAIESGAADAQVWYRRACAHEALHDHDLAVKDLDEVLRGTPEYTAALLERHQILLRKGEYERVLKDLDAAPPGRPDSAVAWALRGAAYRRKGDHDQARVSLDRALKIDPDLAIAYAERGQLCLKLRKLPAAVTDLNEAISLDPGSSIPLAARAQVFALQRKFGQAITDLTVALELDPLDPTAHRQLGEAHSFMNANDRAIAEFDTALRLDPKDAKSHSGRGVAWLIKGDTARAIADFNAAIELDPNEPQAYSARGFAFERAGQTSEALAHYDRAIQLDPEFELPLLHRADLHRSERRFSRAIDDYTRAIQLQPDFPGAWSGRGHAHAELGRWNNAVADFAKVLELVPDDISARCFHSLALLGSGDKQGYRESCTKLLDDPRLTRQPRNAAMVASACLLAPITEHDSARLLPVASAVFASDRTSYASARILGAALLRAGQFDLAVSHLKRAARQQGQAPTIWLLLALAHCQLGHAEECTKWLNDAITCMDQPILETSKEPGIDHPFSWHRLPWMERLGLETLRKEVEELAARRAETSDK